MNPVLRTALITLPFIVAAGLGWSRASDVFERASKARERIPILAAEIKQMQEDLKKSTHAQNLEYQLRQQIQKFDPSYICLHDQPLIWARSSIKDAASDAGVEIITLIESTARHPLPEQGPNGPLFTPFRISLEMSGSESAALRFVRRLEHSNPYVQFHHLSILRLRPDAPLSIFATIEWPMWNGDDKPDLIRQLREIPP